MHQIRTGFVATKLPVSSTHEELHLQNGDGLERRETGVAPITFLPTPGFVSHSSSRCGRRQVRPKSTSTRTRAVVAERPISAEAEVGAGGQVVIDVHEHAMSSIHAGVPVRSRWPPLASSRPRASSKVIESLLYRAPSLWSKFFIVSSSIRGDSFMQSQHSNRKNNSIL